MAEFVPPPPPHLPSPPNGDQSLSRPTTRRYPVWPESIVAMLGVATDRALAQEMRCSVSTVRLRREAMGIPAVRDAAPKDVSEQEIEETRSMSAMQAAKRLGVSYQTVLRRRKQLRRE